MKADPAQVWDALTNPEKTKEYFFNAEVLSDWKEGSKITFKGHMFWIIPFEMTGKILSIKAQKMLKYTLSNSDDSKSFSTVTDTLTYADGVTTLSVTDDVGDGEGAEERYHKSVKGWHKVLKGLKELVEENGQ